MPLFERKKSLVELEEETERADAEAKLEEAKYSVAQKRAMTKQLNQRGLSPKHFGFDFKKIWHWLRTH